MLYIESDPLHKAVSNCLALSRRRLGRDKKVALAEDQNGNGWESRRLKATISKSRLIKMISLLCGGNIGDVKGFEPYEC